MTPIISYAPTGLFAGEERSVTTYPSGLVRVDQTYYCRIRDAASAREALTVGSPMPDGNNDPCTDGLFVFPQPQEKASGDFIEFQVSAYGRTATTPGGIKRQKSFMQWPILNESRGYISAKVDNYDGACVVPANEELTLAQLGIEADEPYRIGIYSASYMDREFTRLVDLGPQPYSPSSFISVPTRVYQVFFALQGGEETERATLRLDDRIFTAPARRNFGVWDEIDFSFKYDGAVSLYPATISPV
jgi:hypothetical protein